MKCGTIVRKIETNNDFLHNAFVGLWYITIDRTEKYGG